MEYSERTINLKKEYLESLKQDVFLWLNNFFDDLKTKNETHISTIVVYVMYDPQGQGMNTYIEDILMFDERDKKIIVPDDIWKKIYKSDFLENLDEIHFTGKIEYTNAELKMYYGVFDEEFKE